MTKLKRFIEPHGLYFITTTTHRRRPFFAKDKPKETALNYLSAIRVKLGFKLYGYVLLPDHLHLLLSPTDKNDVSYIMRQFKLGVSKKIKQKEKIMCPFWQHRFYDHILRTEKEILPTLEYIHENPVKHGLSREADEYPWSSWRNYHRDDHSLIEMDTKWW